MYYIYIYIYIYNGARQKWDLARSAAKTGSLKKFWISSSEVHK